MEEKITDYTNEYPKWDKSMKATHKILIPNMLPWHFLIIQELLKMEGYDVEVLTNDSRNVVDEGLKHVHNDTCYPCLCVVGQYIDALKSGKYDLERTALLITQTGGGCRASNYLPLIRKAVKIDFPNVPVLSLNFSGLEKESSFTVGAKLFLKLAFAIIYGDTMMWCYNQTKPYEAEKGASDIARDEVLEYVVGKFKKGGYAKYKKICAYVIKRFAQIKRTGEKKIKVGIVGEIYVKYSYIANNNLEKFLLSENCEPVVPTLFDFILFMVANYINEHNMYGHHKKSGFIYKLVYRVLHKMQCNVKKIFEREGSFMPIHEMEHLRKYADAIINQGCKMGEGWLIPAEIASFCETGVSNVICAQPFGCLPNHIVGKGTIRTLKSMYPEGNIVAVDYDPSATKVNQENRIKLMLATARDKLDNQIAK